MTSLPHLDALLAKAAKRPWKTSTYNGLTNDYTVIATRLFDADDAVLTVLAVNALEGLVDCLQETNNYCFCNLTKRSEVACEQCERRKALLASLDDAAKKMMEGEK